MQTAIKRKTYAAEILIKSTSFWYSLEVFVHKIDR